MTLDQVIDELCELRDDLGGLGIADVVLHTPEGPRTGHDVTGVDVGSHIGLGRVVRIHGLGR